MQAITDFLSQILSIDQNLTLWQALLAMIIAYCGGILSSLTPCVYPMIPITLSAIGGIGSAKKSWQETLVGGIVYIGGLVVVYSFLGVLAGLSGKVFGSFTNTSGGFFFLGVTLTLASLMMLEVISFDPNTLWEKAKRAFKNGKQSSHPHGSAQLKKEMTKLGAFVLGASSGLIAAPCTTPILTSILAYIAKTQSVGIGFFLMLSFSLGLGTLLLILAVFTGTIQTLPRSGPWMKTLKTISGLMLLAFAEYLIYRSGILGGL